MREVVQICLETVAGWDVLTAASGYEGLETAAREQPDAILLDVMMPDMDGPTTFKQLRANPTTQHIPVILLTAKVLPPKQSNYGEQAIPATIAKPFDPLRLMQQMCEILGWE